MLITRPCQCQDSGAKIVPLVSATQPYAPSPPRSGPNCRPWWTVHMLSAAAPVGVLQVTSTVEQPGVLGKCAYTRTALPTRRACRLLGEYREAADRCERTIGIQQRAGDREGEADSDRRNEGTAYVHLGDALRETADLPGARRAWEQGRRVLDQLDSAAAAGSATGWPGWPAQPSWSIAR